MHFKGPNPQIGIVSPGSKLPFVQNRRTSRTAKGSLSKIWVGHRSEDIVSCFETSKQCFGWLKAKDKLNAEPGQDMITSVNDAVNWILARADCQTPAVSQPPKSSVIIVRLAKITPNPFDGKRKYCLASFQ